MAAASPTTHVASRQQAPFFARFRLGEAVGFVNMAALQQPSAEGRATIWLVDARRSGQMAVARQVFSSILATAALVAALGVVASLVPVH
jgi:hypothetical protein